MKYANGGPMSTVSAATRLNGKAGRQPYLKASKGPRTSAATPKRSRARSALEKPSARPIAVPTLYKDQKMVAAKPSATPSAHWRRACDTSVVRAGDVSGGYVAECDGGPQRDAAAGIVPAHDARRIVAHRIKARYRPPVFGKHLRVLVAAQPRKGTEIANDQFLRVERPFADRRDTWIGLVLGIAERAVVGRGALAELRVFSMLGMFVEILDGTSQPRRIGTDAFGKLFQRAAL